MKAAVAVIPAFCQEEALAQTHIFTHQAPILHTDDGSADSEMEFVPVLSSTHSHVVAHFSDNNDFSCVGKGKNSKW